MTLSFAFSRSAAVAAKRMVEQVRRREEKGAGAAGRWARVMGEGLHALRLERCLEHSLREREKEPDIFVTSGVKIGKDRYNYKQDTPNFYTHTILTQT